MFCSFSSKLQTGETTVSIISCSMCGCVCVRERECVCVPHSFTVILDCSILVSSVCQILAHIIMDLLNRT